MLARIDADVLAEAGGFCGSDIDALHVTRTQDFRALRALKINSFADRAFNELILRRSREQRAREENAARLSKILSFIYSLALSLSLSPVLYAPTLPLPVKEEPTRVFILLFSVGRYCFTAICKLRRPWGHRVNVNCKTVSELLIAIENFT